MSRHKPPKAIHAEWWSPDENCLIRTRYSFSSAQRVVMHFSGIKKGDALTDDEIASSSEHMTALILDVVESWTLRDESKPYKKGVERPIIPLDAETIGELELADNTFIFTEAMAVFRSISPTVPAAGLINEKARAMGLTPESFQSGDSA